jgi:hypothetical protein
MSKVTISDFAIALFELAEAEGKNLQESVQGFLATERQALENTAMRSGLAVALIAAAVISLLAALGFLSWGVYVLSAAFISPLAAPFITGALWLLISLTFALTAGRKKSNGK